MLQSQLIKKILAISAILLSYPAFAQDTIGEIVEQTGIGNIIREGINIPSANMPSVNLYDEAETGNGRMLIEFLDEEELALTEHTLVFIDEVYYDPNPDLSKMSMRMVMGTARFASGKLGKMNKSNIAISTPTANIAINGTDFTTTIDELGRSLIILLPDANGDASGEIIVSNESGLEVTLNEAYSATMVSTISSYPTAPVVINNISANLINNMFIVSPPADVQNVIDESSTTSDDGGILDVDFLEFDGLDADALKDSDGDLEFTELDVDLLDVDFLQDLLDVIEELDRKVGIQKSFGGSSGGNNYGIEGTLIGFDKDTQYNTFVDTASGTVKFFREVEGTISITLPIDAMARIYTVTNEKESVIEMGGDSAINIEIRQTN
tara:strand:+ start:2132 stop:3274 length:1143 start_codon:yes stop_codon:yes gene_type:complete